MNFAEELVYWYLRLNGFIPLTNFVLHRDEVHRTSDADVVAVRFPHVFEEIGGQPHDWDEQFERWGINLARDTIGLVVEVKTGDWHVEDLANREWRIRRGLERIGMLQRPGQQLERVVAELAANPV